MRRREFIGLIAGATVWPRGTQAQTRGRMPKVGYLAGGNLTGLGHVIDAFRRGLRDYGYVEGQSITLDVRSSDGRTEVMRELITELINSKVDVLVTGNSGAALAAKGATSTIPIVMFAGDPVALGLVDSLAHPGGNITGLSYLNAELHGKRIELLKELVPSISRVAVLRNPGLAMHEFFWRDTLDAARKFGVELQAVEVRGPEDFEPAFDIAQRDGAHAVIVFDDPLTVGHKSTIVGLAARVRLPAIYGFREFVDEGGLISYGPNFVVLMRRAATFVDKILKGASPAILPIEQATNFELVLNLKAARHLGATIPATMIARADEVIE